MENCTSACDAVEEVVEVRRSAVPELPTAGDGVLSNSSLSAQKQYKTVLQKQYKTVLSQVRVYVLLASCTSIKMYSLPSFTVQNSVKEREIA